jgi:hypothetical protein
MAEKEMSNSTMRIIFAAVAVILGLALLSGSIAPQVNSATSLSFANESFNYSSAFVNSTYGLNTSVASMNYTEVRAPTGWELNGGCPNPLIAVGNSTGTWTNATDYNYYPLTGQVQLLNTTKTINGGNISLVQYNYCGSNYVTGSFSQTTLNLVPGFFALALMAVGIWLFYGLYRDLNIF